MFEVYVLVPRKSEPFLKLLAAICFIIGGLAVLGALVGIYVFLPIAVAGIALGVFLITRNYEYEYSFFDGDVRFAKIINKSKRKTLNGYTMDDIIIIAPIGDRSVHHYLNDSKITVRNLTSGNNNPNVYVMVAKGEKGMEMVKFEPDEKYLDAVCVKYRQKVVR